LPLTLQPDPGGGALALNPKINAIATVYGDFLDSLA
jgi:hypothetical protein